MSELVTMTDTNTGASQPVMPTFDTTGLTQEAQEKKGSMRLLLPFVFVAIVAGIGTGYVLSTKLSPASLGKTTSKQTAGTTADTKAEQVAVGGVYGSKDSSTFKDSAEGVLLPGGVNGEGSHHIVREGGESQNVYLTSSIVDLKTFENHKVLVKGETFKAQRAGWLMDVGQVKVLELNAALPDWAQKAAEKNATKAGEGD